MRNSIISEGTQTSRPERGSHGSRSNPIRSWDTFWEGFTDRYGQPKTLSHDPIQNKLGAAFDNTVAVWDNGESTITLGKRLLEIERLLIRLDHTALLSLMCASGLKAREVDRKTTHNLPTERVSSAARVPSAASL